jgi:hypothetical protein
VTGVASNAKRTEVSLKLKDDSMRPDVTAEDHQQAE